ncbi:MAG: hypothetical protein Q4D67_00810 [Streptococcus minor]|nr:hypothetical protein [Streptococcus minor]
MKSNIIDGLYLLFVARQGYWDSSNKVNFKEFWKYIYSYFLISFLLLLCLPFLKDHIINFLQSHRFLSIISYEVIFLAIFYLLIPFGLAYENFYVEKSNTPDTFRLFFNVSNKQFSHLLLYKNSILMLPAMVISLFFFNPWITVLLFLMVHFLSQKFSKVLLDISAPKIHFGSDLSYILSLLDIVSFIKTVGIPIISVGVFMVLFVYQPEFLALQFTTFNQLLLSSLFLGTVFYSSKGFPYLFLSLINDLPYMKAIGLDTERFIHSKMFFLLTINFLTGLIPLAVFLIYQQFSIFQTLCLCLGLLFSYLAMQGFQMREALFFKDKYIKNIKELEVYKFPLKHHIYTWLTRLLFAGLFLLDKYLSANFYWLISLIIIFVLLGSFVINYFSTVKQFTT